MEATLASPRVSELKAGALLLTLACCLSGVFAWFWVDPTVLGVVLAEPNPEDKYEGQATGALACDLVFPPEIEEQLVITKQELVRHRRNAVYVLRVLPAALLLAGFAVRARRRRFGEELLRLGPTLAVVFGLCGLAAELVFFAFLSWQGVVTLAVIAAQLASPFALRSAGFPLTGERGLRPVARYGIVVGLFLAGVALSSALAPGR